MTTKGGSAYTAPVYYLEDKASDVAETVEAANWESHTNNRLGLALKSLDERSQHIVRSRWLDDNKSTLQDWRIPTVFQLSVYVS